MTQHKYHLVSGGDTKSRKRLEKGKYNVKSSIECNALDMQTTEEGK